MNTRALTFSVVLLAGVAISAEQSADANKTIVKSYVEVQSHLAADRLEPAKNAAKEMAAPAASLGKSGEAIAKAATAMAAAADLKAARDAFGPLSDAVIARVQSEEGKEAAAELRLAYCPMVKRSWLQREEQIRNPYYGSQMLTCGEFKQLKK